MPVTGPPRRPGRGHRATASRPARREGPVVASSAASRTPSGTATCVPPVDGAVGQRRAADRRPWVRVDGAGPTARPARRRARARRRRRRVRRGTGGRARRSSAGGLVERYDGTPASARRAAGPCVVVERDQPEVAGPVDQVAATVVEHEQEPSGQRRQRRVGAQQPVELVGHRPQVGASTGQAGLRRDHHVAHQLVGARGQQPGGRDRLDDLVREAVVRRPASRAAAGWRARSGARRRRRTSGPPRRAPRATYP